MVLTTVTYIKNQDKILMLHRTKEENDFNQGKWLGIGGHIEEYESPREASVREIKEETNFDIEKADLNFKGFVTFTHESKGTNYIFIYTVNTEQSNFKDCSEGYLKWIDRDEVLNLELWPGDRIFLPHVLNEAEGIFSIKLEHDKDSNLKNSIIEYGLD